MTKKTGKQPRSRSRRQVLQMFDRYRHGDTLDMVGKRYDLTGSRIRQLFKREGIDYRPFFNRLPGQSKKGVRVKIEPSVLFDLYVVKQLTLKSTAERLGVSLNTVRRNLIENEIPIRKKGGQTWLNKKLYPEITELRLRTMIADDKFSVKAAANHFGCSKFTIYRLIRKFGIVFK